MISALDERWRDLLVDIARARNVPALTEIARLGPLLAELSVSYNLGDATRARALLPARLGFSFPRDVPKAEGAVRELCARGVLRMPEGRALRVLDLGAGLGAMTIGLARAIAFAGGRGEILATWIDADKAAMELGRDIAARAPLEKMRVNVTPHVENISRAKPSSKRGAFDVILCGQVMSELDTELAPEERVVKHAEWLASLMRVLAEDGSLVVVEPALADRTRHLHAVRNAILADPRITLFSPCLHRESCPALATETDWCHEDLAVDLPPWLVPLARAAGLRFQGLTFSYLVLRKDGATLREKSGGSLRVVSSRIRTKGKIELFLCGEFEGGVARAKVMRLDRDACDENAAIEDASRGDVLSIHPTPAPRARINRDSRVTRT